MTAYYTQNWLSFYDQEQIRQRQERWEKEQDAYPKLNKRTYEETEVEEAVEKDVEEVLEPIVNNMPKVGRNEPCPCGSGKKYKKCCMGNEIIERRV
ncbi:MAG: motif domain protein [Candidatus Brocadiaceae bacterium]|nr:motif domain protein [Candidatus Brocadiaceae bacterium]